MTANTPSDRVQLRSQGELVLPGSCALCGSGNCDEGYLDFSLWFEFYGTFYLCVTCFKQAADVADFLHPDVAEHIKETNQALATQNAQLLEELERKNDLLAQWDAVIVAATSGTITNATALASLGVGSSEVDADAAQDNGETPVGSDKGEPVAKKPTASGRRSKPSSTPADNGSSANGQFDL